MAVNPNIDLSVLSQTLDELLKQADLSDVNAESAMSNDLPDGYYLCEVTKAEFTVSKSSGNPMIAFQFKVVEDGIKTVIDDYGYEKLLPAMKTKGRIIFKNYVLNNLSNLNFFVSDMLKFEYPTDDHPAIFDKSMFDTTENIAACLDILEDQACRIYMMVQTKPKKNNPEEKEKVYNAISWKRVGQLELPA